MEKRDNFADQWNDAFDGAELTPDKLVWSGIRAEMANRSADKYKRSAIYFRWLAAASVTLLIGVVIASSYYFNEVSTNSNHGSSEIISRNSTDILDDNTTTENNISQLDGSLTIENSNSPVGIEDGEAALTSSSLSKSESNTKSIDEVIANNEKDIALNKDVKNSSFNNLKANNYQQISNSQFPAIVDGESDSEVGFGVAFPESNEKAESKFDHDNNSLSILSGKEFTSLSNDGNAEVRVNKIPTLDDLLIIKKKSNYKDMWAGVSFGGGNFDPNMSYDQTNVYGVAFDNQGINNIAANKVASAQVAEQTPAFSYGLGIDFGTKITPKLVMQSGLQYKKYSSETISSFELQNSGSGQNEAFILTADRALDFSENLNTTTSYQVNNEFEYLSIPLEMGYLIVDRKIGFLLSSGIATDFFVKNTISDNTNQREDVTVGNGGSSPYKSINWNGLIGGELYYSVHENYLVALEPSYKFSLDGITKSDANFMSKPQSLFIGFKFKYFIR